MQRSSNVSPKEAILALLKALGAVPLRQTTALPGAQLAARGALVYATARRLAAMEGLAERGCRLLQLDVTDNGSVQRAVEVIICLLYTSRRG